MTTITPTIQPLPKQHLAWNKLLDKVTKYLLFGGGAGGGKSWLGCEWLLVMCYQYPKSKWFIGRKELKRLMASSYETFKKVCSFHNIPETDWKLNGQYNYIEFINGSKIDLLDVNFVPADPIFERFGSLEYTGGWLEEAGEIDFKAFDVLKTRVGRHLNKEYGLHPKLLITANPKKGWLKRLFYIPFKNGTLSKAYAFVKSLYSDNSYTSDIYGEQLNEISDKATRDRLRDGNWDYDDDKACLIKGENIDDLFTNTVDDGEKYATLDIARFGKDTSKLYLWKGFKNYKRITWKNKATNILAGLVKEVLVEEKIPYSHVIGDEVGVGGGVIDDLVGINGFIANASPLENPNSKKIIVVRNGKETEITQKENYRTLKDQCGYMLADKVNSHEMSLEVNDESEREYISEEIGELKDFAPDEDGKKRLVPKDIIKENIGRSPDDLDNLIMRMWFELKPNQIPSSSLYVPNNEL